MGRPNRTCFFLVDKAREGKAREGRVWTNGMNGGLREQLIREYSSLWSGDSWERPLRRDCSVSQCSRVGHILEPMERREEASLKFGQIQVADIMSRLVNEDKQLR